MHGPRDVYKPTLEIRTPPLIRTHRTVPRVSAIEKLHCIHNSPKVWGFISKRDLLELSYIALLPGVATMTHFKEYVNSEREREMPLWVMFP